MLMWSEDRVFNIGEDLENHCWSPVPITVALHCPIWALVPEIIGSLGHGDLQPRTSFLNGVTSTRKRHTKWEEEENPVRQP